MLDQAEATLFSATEDTQHESQATAPVADESAAAAPADWHAEAGRKGARRLQELIEEGKRYEQQHGLKRGRQRIRQLIELGKRYEQENGLRQPRTGQRRPRLAQGERDELLATLLQCLVRLAKPSFRPDLARLVDALQANDASASASGAA